MNAPVANSTRASLEVARVALGRMMGAPPAPGAPRTVPMTMAARASDAWKSSEILLRVLTSRPDLAGQALLTEARRVDALDMDGMHALVAMREWVERTLAPGSAAQMLTLPPTDAERDVAANALAALERATGLGTASAGVETHSVSAAPADVANVGASQLPPSPDMGSRSPWAPQPTGDGVRDASGTTIKPPVGWAPPVISNRVVPPPFNDASGGMSHDQSSVVLDGNAGKRSLSSGMIMAVLLLIVLIGSGGAFFYFKGRGGGVGAASSSLTEQGAAAYSRGAKEAARIAFVKAIEENPEDARALTYLGRISREQGSTATARQYLERAIRIEPNNALASRELGSALLADKQYELARRFYVRALTINPSDRIAQGFLGCALILLNRSEEATRWFERAGTGEWSNCRAGAASASPTTKD